MAFPTFPGRSREVVVERERPVSVFVSASGRSLASSFRSADVRHIRYTVLMREGKTAAAPWAAYDEPGALRAEWAAIGMTGTDTHWNPEGAGTITVRFEAPPAFRRVTKGLWQAEVELVEVL